MYREITARKYISYKNIKYLICNIYLNCKNYPYTFKVINYSCKLGFFTYYTFETRRNENYMNRGSGGYFRYPANKYLCILLYQRTHDFMPLEAVSASLWAWYYNRPC